MNLDASLSDVQKQKVMQASSAIFQTLELSIELLEDIQLISQSEIESNYEKKLSDIWKRTFHKNRPSLVLEKFLFLKKQMMMNLTHIRYGDQAMCKVEPASGHLKQNIEKVAFVLMLKDQKTGKLIPYDVDKQQVSDEAIIYLCDVWFDHADLSVQIATLMHELSHWYLKTDDHAYIHERDKYKLLTSLERLNNADTYAQFIYFVLALRKSELNQFDDKPYV